MNDTCSRAAGKASEFAAGDIESILSDAAPMSDAAATLAAGVVLGLAFLNLSYTDILRSFRSRLAESLFCLPRLPTRLVDSSPMTPSGTISPRRAFASLLPVEEEECRLPAINAGGGYLARRAGEIRMTINGARRAALILLASCAASAASAQTGRAQNGEFVRLDRPAAFDLNPNTGSLKESVQKGQELVWHPKDKPNEARFKVTNMSVAFLRSESGGQVKMTFTGNISSLSYSTLEEVKLNANVRAKGGASLHSWSFGISVKCGDKDQPLTPLTHDVPNDLAQNIFANVSTVEIAEPAEPTFPGVKVQRCN